MLLGIMSGLRTGVQTVGLTPIRQRGYSSFIGFAVENFNKKPLSHRIALSLIVGSVGEITSDLFAYCLNVRSAPKTPTEKK